MKAYRINIELNESFHIYCEIIFLPTFICLDFKIVRVKKGFYCTSRLLIVWIIKSLLDLI